MSDKSVICPACGHYMPEGDRIPIHSACLDQPTYTEVERLDRPGNRANLTPDPRAALAEIRHIDAIGESYVCNCPLHTETEQPRTPIPDTPGWHVPLCFSPVGPCKLDIGHDGPHAAQR